ncbi:unnamed protein product [Medioppia subpectinata]|uniref:Histone-lysine N-methyltransferase n=1 Tax=Medioppia subpectinata TaxID=1979941 RepID=A0A7R9PXJ1_9ACAR|nr:unnamed protein product [Medioppia subpectinata]CAG2104447.1 unnamed protein product [Medioppia subpectinata]
MPTVSLFTTRAIKPYEELTYDYGNQLIDMYDFSGADDSQSVSSASDSYKTATMDVTQEVDSNGNCNGVTNGVSNGVSNGLSNGVVNGETSGVSNCVANGGGESRPAADRPERLALKRIECTHLSTNNVTKHVVNKKSAKESTSVEEEEEELAISSWDEFDKFVDYVKWAVGNGLQDLAALYRLSDHKHSVDELRANKKLVRQLKNQMKTNIGHFLSLKFDRLKPETNNQERQRAMRAVKGVAIILRLKDNGFETLTDWFKFIDRRSEMAKRLARFADKCNKVIAEKREGVRISVANDYDLEVPVLEQYVCECVYDKSLFPKSTIKSCECDDCFKDRKTCCPSRTASFPMVYNQKGLLRDDILNEIENPMIIECTECKCGADCPNRVIQRGRRYRLQIYRPPDAAVRGWAVRALQRIPSGAFVSNYTGEVVSSSEANKRPNIYFYLKNTHDRSAVDDSQSVSGAGDSVNTTKDLTEEADSNGNDVSTGVANGGGESRPAADRPERLALKRIELYAMDACFTHWCPLLRVTFTYTLFETMPKRNPKSVTKKSAKSYALVEEEEEEELAIVWESLAIVNLEITSNESRDTADTNDSETVNGRHPPKESWDELDAFTKYLKRVVSHGFDDLAVLYRMSDHKHTVAELRANQKLVVTLKTEIEAKVRDFFVQKFERKTNLERNRAMQAVKDVAKQLRLAANGFPTLTDWFDFIDQRSKVAKRLARFVNKCNKEITETGEGLEISVANDYDLEVPELEEYVGECVYDSRETPKLTATDAEKYTIPSCECQDCFKQQDECCTPPGIPMIYDRKGLLQKTILNKINNPMIFECNRNCKCGADCPNRVIQRGRRYRLQIYRPPDAAERGWAVRALERIPSGAFVSNYSGEVISSTEADKRPNIYLFDAIWPMNRWIGTVDDRANEYVIDAYKCGNVSRFINHSCEPNCAVFYSYINSDNKQLPTVSLFTTRAIKPYEELTYDYGNAFTTAPTNVTEEADSTGNCNGVANGVSNGVSNGVANDVTTGGGESRPAADDSQSVTSADHSFNTTIDLTEEADSNGNGVSTGVANGGGESRSAADRPERLVLKRIDCNCGSKYCRKSLQISGHKKRPQIEISLILLGFWSSSPSFSTLINLLVLHLSLQKCLLFHIFHLFSHFFSLLFSGRHVLPVLLLLPPLVSLIRLQTLQCLHFVGLPGVQYLLPELRGRADGTLHTTITTVRLGVRLMATTGGDRRLIAASVIVIMA